MQQRIDKISSKKYQTNIHLLFLVVSCLFEGNTMKKVRYLIGMKSELSVRFSRLKQLISFRLLINLNSEMCEFDKLDKTFTSDLYLILMNCTLRHGDHCWWNLNKRISFFCLWHQQSRQTFVFWISRDLLQVINTNWSRELEFVHQITSAVRHIWSIT